MNKGQVATEYVLIIGAMVALLLPLLIISVDKSASLTHDVQQEIIFTLGNQIVDKAETIYYLGEPSRTQMKIRIPQNVQSINLTNKELVFFISGVQGTTEIVIPSSINLSGSIPTTQGMHFITIENKGTYVSIN